MSKEQKKYRLDLSVYQIETVGKIPGKEGEKPVMGPVMVDYPMRENLADFLRTAGMFNTAVEVVDAVMLAREIKKCTSEFLIFDEKEARTIKTVVDKLLMRAADGKCNFGGLMHEELICRVVNMEEITE